LPESNCQILPLDNSTVCQINPFDNDSICQNLIAQQIILNIEFAKSILLTIKFDRVTFPNSTSFWQFTLPNWFFFWQLNLLKSNCQILPLDNAVCPWSFFWQFSLLKPNCPIDPFDNSVCQIDPPFDIWVCRDQIAQYNLLVCYIDSSFDNQVCWNQISKSFLWTIQFSFLWKIQFAKSFLLTIKFLAGIKLPNPSFFWQYSLPNQFIWQFNLICQNQIAKSILLTIKFAQIKWPNTSYWQFTLPNWSSFWQFSLPE